MAVADRLSRCDLRLSAQLPSRAAEDTVTGLGADAESVSRDDALVAMLRRERLAYGLPPGLRQLADRFAYGLLGRAPLSPFRAGGSRGGRRGR